MNNQGNNVKKKKKKQAKFSYRGLQKRVSGQNASK